MTPAAFRRAVAFLFAVTASSQTTGTGSLSGTVLNSVTNQPIPKALVRLELGRNLSAAEITDGSGRFLFQNLPAGQYRLFAGKEGFQGLAYGTRSNAQAGTFIPLAAAESRNDLTFWLPPTAIVSGTVLDSDGEPITGAQIFLLRPMYQRGRLELIPTFNATTDDRGAYRISNIQPGRYYVQANSSQTMQFAGMARQNSDPVTIPEFFPGTPNRNRATLFDLRDGKELRGIDFRLTHFSPGVVLARVILPSGMPPDFGMSFGINMLSDLRGGSRAINTRSQGSALRAEVPPGEHIVWIDFNFNGTSYYGATRVTVQPGKEEEVTITPKPLLDLPCQVKVEGPGNEKYTQFRLTLTPPQQRNAQPPPQAEWKAGGNCKFTGVRPGIWDIGIAPLASNLYLKAMTWGGKDVLNDEMELRDQSEDVLTVVVSTLAAEITGEVEKAESGQIQPAIVLFAPAVHQFSTIQFYRTVLTDADGKFRFGGLPPGNYRVFAFEQLEFNAWQDPEFLKPYVASAVPIRLGEGQKTTIKVRRIPEAKQEGKP